MRRSAGFVEDPLSAIGRTTAAAPEGVFFETYTRDLSPEDLKRLFTQTPRRVPVLHART